MMKKQKLLIAAAFVGIAVLIFFSLFYVTDGKLLAITEKNIQANKCTVSNGAILINKDFIEKIILNSKQNFNNEYYNKYNGLLAKQKLFYILTKAEYIELVLSAPPVQKADEYWQTMKYKEINVTGNGDITAY